MAENKKGVERAFLELGWEVRREDERPDAVMAGYGKYHLMVSLEAGEPTSVVVSCVGKGGGILSSKWLGAERLPTPRSVMRELSEEA